MDWNIRRDHPVVVCIDDEPSKPELYELIGTGTLQIVKGLTGKEGLRLLNVWQTSPLDMCLIAKGLMTHIGC